MIRVPGARFSKVPKVFGSSHFLFAIIKASQKNSVSKQANGSFVNGFSGSGCRDGAVVRALASHQCGPGSIPRLGVISGLSLSVVLYPAPRGFLRVFRFPLSSKTNI